MRRECLRCRGDGVLTELEVKPELETSQASVEARIWAMVLRDSALSTKKSVSCVFSFAASRVTGSVRHALFAAKISEAARGRFWSSHQEKVATEVLGWAAP